MRRSFQRNARVAPAEDVPQGAGAGDESQQGAGEGPRRPEAVAESFAGVGGEGALAIAGGSPLSRSKGGSEPSPEAGSCAAPLVFSSWLRKPPALPARTSSLDSFAGGTSTSAENEALSPDAFAAAFADQPAALSDPRQLPVGHPIPHPGAAASGGGCPVLRMASAGGGGMGGCPVFRGGTQGDIAAFLTDHTGTVAAAGPFGGGGVSGGGGACPIAADAPLAEVRWVKGEPCLRLVKKKKPGADELHSAAERREDPAPVERNLEALVRDVGGTPTLLVAPRAALASHRTDRRGQYTSSLSFESVRPPRSSFCMRSLLHWVLNRDVICPVAGLIAQQSSRRPLRAASGTATRHPPL